MNADDAPDDIRTLLRDHGLEAVAEHHASELADRIRWAKSGKAHTLRTLSSRDLQQCATAAKRLARHQEHPPSNPGATVRARARLLESLDNISSVVAIAAQPDSVDITSMLELLRAGETPDGPSLDALARALTSVPHSTGASPPSARNGLIRSAVLAWRSVYDKGGYWYDSEFSNNEMRGALPRFIEAVLKSAGHTMPSGDALHSQIRKLTDID
jgi:hypothetical protein